MLSNGAIKTSANENSLLLYSVDIKGYSMLCLRLNLKHPLIKNISGEQKHRSFHTETVSMQCILPCFSDKIRSR